ncbi:MAG: SusD/RagB family nutrient-binding outer membrane lipoprotein [Bacteroidales bacterium]
MKKAINKILSVILLIVIVTGCSKLSDFGDTNVNPAATNEPITAALLSNVLSGMQGYATGTRGGLYCQYFSETQYTDVSLYSLPQLSSTGYYSGYLYDLENIVIKNTDEATKDAAALNGANENQIAVARILQSYFFWWLTDQWGDLPYSTALLGDPNITFDPQEDIYKGVIATLASAVDMFVDGGATLKGDLHFKGDIAKWKKFANSMRVLMAIRLSNRYPGASDYAATQLKAALSHPAGVIENNSDNFAINPPGGNFRNRWYALYDGRSDYALSKEMADRLMDINDTRVNIFGTSTVGVPYGLKRADAEQFTSTNPTWARIMSAEWQADNSTVFVLTAGQVWLARAEAADRGWTTENMLNAFNNGVTASHTQWGIDPPTPAYLAFVAPTEAAGTNANIGTIALQQYIAFYPDGWNGWSNWRRTEIPTLIPTPNATIDPSRIPIRYTYGTSEWATSKEAVEEAIARLTGSPTAPDSPDLPVWWMNK